LKFISGNITNRFGAEQLFSSLAEPLWPGKSWGCTLGDSTQ